MKSSKISIILLYLILNILNYNCESLSRESNYPERTGDIEFNHEIDTTDFKLCKPNLMVKQYYNFSQGIQYLGEKKELKRIFEASYKTVDINESGWIRIRFVVNCKGETGRFRLMASDANYEKFTFDERITNQLMSITKSLNGWIPLTYYNRPRDYYQYLVFKIENGKMKDIMP